MYRMCSMPAALVLLLVSISYMFVFAFILSLQLMVLFSPKLDKSNAKPNANKTIF